MNDLKNMLIYVGSTAAVVAILIGLSKWDVIPGSMVGFAAVALVIVLPILIAVKIGKKERENRKD